MTCPESLNPNSEPHSLQGDNRPTVTANQTYNSKQQVVVANGEAAALADQNNGNGREESSMVADLTES